MLYNGTVYRMVHVQMMQPWLGDCRLRKLGSDQEFLCSAAIWAGSYHECQVLLRDHAQTMGHRVIEVQGFHPEDGQWLSRTGHEALLLAKRVTAESPVVLGLLAPANGETYPRTPQNGLMVEALEPIQPLRPTDVAWQDGDLPGTVMETLFGQPSLLQGSPASHDAAAVLPPLRTYIILDATKLGSGASEIECCDMPFQSLFIGKAARDLADIAPYIVQLDPRKRFTRRLFRYDPRLPAKMTSMHLWHREPGIYIRTRLTMDEIRRRFRRFTRVRDDSGAWFVLRFYDPNVLLDMAEHLEEANRQRFFTPDIEVIALRKDGTGYKIRG